MGKKLMALLLCVCLMASFTLTGCGSKSADGQEVKVIRVAFNQNENHPQYKAMKELGEKFEKATNGRYKMTIYANGVLGEQGSMAEFIRTGALAQSNVVANMLFGAISGSGAAAAAAMGGTIGPLEEKEGYDKNYSTAVNVASAPVGMLIPPSNTMIVYSSVAGSVSIAALFMAGYIPGLLWGGAVMILAGIMAKKRGYQAEQRVPVKVALKTFWQAIPSLLLIVIVIGGILGGIFTATEGSAIAVVYATVLSLIYKAFKIKDIPRIVLEAAKTTGIITFMIGLSSIMSWAMAFTGIPDMIANAILGLTTNKYLILLLINVLLLVVGTFMDVTPAILIFTPILLPICKSFGMDPIHFGILLCFNLSIGTITPPVGTILFTGCRVGGTTIESVIKTLLPYFAIILIALLLVTYIPMLSMFLPKVLGLV